MQPGDKKNRNDFSVTVWKGREKVHFMKYVNSIPYYQKSLANDGIDWDYMNVYWRRSGDFERRIYK